MIEGYLKSGSLKFNLKNGNENNFKLESVMIEERDDIELDSVDSLLFDDGKEKNEEPKNEIIENVVSDKDSSENVVQENKVVDEVKNEDDKEIDGVNPLKDLLKNAASEFIEDEVKSSALSNLIGESQLKDEIKENIPKEEEKESDDVVLE